MKKLLTLGILLFTALLIAGRIRSARQNGRYIKPL